MIYSQKYTPPHCFFCIFAGFDNNFSLSFSHCYLFVVVLESPKLPANLNTTSFFHDTNVRRRRRRETGNSALPESYIAGFFKNKDLPMTFKLGDGSQDGNIINQPLEDGKYYSTFIRAYVRTVGYCCSGLYNSNSP